MEKWISFYKDKYQLFFQLSGVLDEKEEQTSNNKTEWPKNEKCVFHNCREYLQYEISEKSKNNRGRNQ